MGWSPWLRLADKNWFYVEQKMWDPVCYELALGPTSVERDEQLELVLLGTAAHEEELFSALEGGEAPISTRLRAALDAGRTLYYRVQARPQRDAVEEIRRARREEHGAYAWEETQ